MKALVSACEPHREIIAAALARDRNAMAIYQHLHEQAFRVARDGERRQLTRT